jgi:hypothetical protein
VKGPERLKSRAGRHAGLTGGFYQPRASKVKTGASGFRVDSQE